MNAPEVTSAALPATIDAIDPASFAAFPNLRSITVSDQNKSFGSYNGMLFNEELTSLLLVPEGLEGKAVLPDTMVSVPAYVLSRCTKLSAISLFPETGSNGALFTTEDGILYNADKTELVAAPAGLGVSARIAPECIRIAEGAFFGNAELATIVASGTVEEIAQNAFSDATIESARVALPADAARTAWEAAGFTKFTEPAQPGAASTLVYAESGMVYTLLDDYTLGVHWEGNKAEAHGTLEIPRTAQLDDVVYTVSTIESGAFEGAAGIEEVKLPDSITTIGQAAFKSTGVKKITLPGGVAELSASAFEDCANLAEVSLPAGLTSLGDAAFADTALETITLPASVREIGARAFAGCAQLTTIVTLGSVSEVGTTALDGCAGASVYVPAQQSGSAWKLGVPANGNHLLEYGIAPTSTSFTLEVGESVNLFADGGLLMVPEGVQLSTSYKAQALSVDADGTVTAKQPGAAPVNMTLVLGDQQLARSTANILVKRTYTQPEPGRADVPDAEGGDEADEGDDEGGDEGDEADTSDEGVGNAVEGDANKDTDDTANADQVAGEEVSDLGGGDDKDASAGVAEGEEVVLPQEIEVVEGEDFTTSNGVPMISRAVSLAAAVPLATTDTSSNRNIRFFAPSGQYLSMKITYQEGIGNWGTTTVKGNEYGPDIRGTNVVFRNGYFDLFGEHTGSRGYCNYRIGTDDAAYLSPGEEYDANPDKLNKVWMVRFGKKLANSPGAADVLDTLDMPNHPASYDTYERRLDAGTYGTRVYVNGARNSTVTWNPNGGTCSTASSTARPYEILTAPTPNARTGYTFAGWYTAASAGTKVCDSGGSTPRILPATPTTYYAHWTPNTYTIRYNANGGSGAMGDTSCTYDSNVTLRSNAFSRSGYVFAGWATTSTGDRVYSNLQTLLTPNLTSTNGGIVTLYARWSPQVKTTIYWNKASSNNLFSQIDGATAPLDATYSSSPVTPSQVAINVRNFYFESAGYLRLAGEYTSTGNGGGAIGDEAFGTTSARSGITSIFVVRLKNNGTLVHSGYAVKGGSANVIDGNVIWQDGADLRFYLNGAEKKTVTWNANGGSVSPSSTTVNMYDTVSAPTPTRPGYTFAGWYTSGGSQLTSSTRITGDITYYAHWTANTYTIRYNGNGNTSGSTADTSCTYDANVTLQANGFAKTGYHFAGWATSATGAVAYSGGQTLTKPNFTSGNGGVYTLYAKWTANTYTISYNYNSGALPSGTTQPNWNSSTGKSNYTIESATFTLANPVRTGYTFTGWTITGASYISGGGTTNGTSAQVKKGTYGNLTATANWRANTYTVTLTGKDADVSKGTTVIYLRYDTGWFSDSACANAIKTITPPKRNGYTFGGYANVANASGTITAANNAFTQNISRDPIWNINTYNITYNYAENVNPGSAVTKPSNPATYTIESNTFTLANPTRPGYTFTGWTIAGASYISGGGTTNGTSAQVKKGTFGHLTATANWRANTYTVSYVYNGGSLPSGVTQPNWNASTGKTNFTIESLTFTLANPVRPGYTFTGWTITGANSIAGGGVVNGLTAQVRQGTYGNLTATASWTANLYTVSFEPNAGDTGDDANGHITNMPDAFQILFSEPSLNPANQVKLLPAQVPLRVGYVFKGWRLVATDMNGAQVDTIYNPGDQYRHPFVGDVTMQAQWEQNIGYHVNFYRFTEDGPEDKLKLPGGYLSGELTYEETFPLPLADMVADADKVSGYFLYGWSWSKEAGENGAELSSFVLPHTTSVRELFECLGVQPGDTETKDIDLYAVWQMVYNVTAPTNASTAGIVLDASENTVYRGSGIAFESSTPCEVAVGARTTYFDQSLFKQIFGSRLRSNWVSFTFGEGDDPAEPPDPDMVAMFPLEPRYGSPYSWTFDSSGNVVLPEELTRISAGSGVGSDPARLEGVLSLDFPSEMADISHELQEAPDGSGLMMNGKRWEDPLATITWMFACDEASAISYTLLPHMPAAGSRPGFGEVDIKADGTPFVNADGTEYIRGD